MAILDGNDLLRKINMRQGSGVSGKSAATTKLNLPPLPERRTVNAEPVGNAVVTKQVESVPEYTVKPTESAVSEAPVTAAVEDYSKYLEQMHEAKRQAAVAGLEAAYRQNVAALDRSKENVAEQYRVARNQTAGELEQAKHNFAQYAAASGLNSGTSGQAELARSVSLQGSLGAINAREASAMADLELQRAQIEAEYNTAIARARAEGDFELAEALYQEKIRVESAIREEQKYADSRAQQKWQNEFNERQYADEKAQREYENWFARKQYDDAMTQQEWENKFASQKYLDGQTQTQRETLAGYGQAYLQSGVMPSDEMLSAMGISRADAQVYIEALQKSKTDDASKMSLSTAKEAAENGYFDDGVIAVLKANGYTNDMLKTLYGYEAHAASGTIGGKTVEEYDKAAGNYASVKDLADNMKVSGAATSDILAMLKEAWETGVLNTNDYMSLVNKYRG